MSKLLVVGVGPLFDKGVRNFAGQCLRTWCFVEPLLADGHTVRLVTLPIYDAEAADDMAQAALLRRSCRGFEYQAFSNCDFTFIQRTLTEVARSLNPDGIVAVNTTPSWIAAQLPLRLPLWADLFGYEMAEKQGQAAHMGSDEPLTLAWRRETLVARRADKVSTVSIPQQRALLGEMAAVGRLNRHTFHYEFAHRVQTSYHPVFAEALDPSAPPLLRGRVVPVDAFVLLWTGGYNYWTNPRLLFDYLEGVLATDSRFHYVSTGGAIEGYNTETYSEFNRLVETSPHRERYHLLGWVPASDLPAIYHEADLGLNIDEPNYETFFGARNRLNNLMVAGVPVLTTYGSEISQIIEEARCGVVCSPEDAQALVTATLGLAESGGRLRDLSVRAREYALEHFAPERVTEPVRVWARAPRFAPDNAMKLERFPEALRLIDVVSNPLEEIAATMHAYQIEDLRDARSELDAIRANPCYRVLKGTKDLASAMWRKCLGAKTLGR